MNEIIEILTMIIAITGVLVLVLVYADDIEDAIRAVVLKPRQVARFLARLRFHDDGTPLGRRTLDGRRIVKYPANGSRP